MDSFFSNSTMQFIGIQLFVGATMVCVKKLYTIMCHIEEDKNRKFYMQYYKIGQLESELDTLKGEVTGLAQVCEQLRSQIASAHLVHSGSMETCAIEDVFLQIPTKPSFNDCVQVVLANVDLTTDSNANAEVGLSIQEEIGETDEVIVQPIEPEGHDGNKQREAYKYKYGLGFLMGSK